MKPVIKYLSFVLIVGLIGYFGRSADNFLAQIIILALASFIASLLLMGLKNAPKALVLVGTGTVLIYLGHLFDINQTVLIIFSALFLSLLDYQVDIMLKNYRN